MIVVKEIGFDFGLELRSYIFISHISIHGIESVLNLLFFTIKLLYNTPNLVNTVSINKTTNVLNANSV